MTPINDLIISPCCNEARMLIQRTASGARSTTDALTFDGSLMIHMRQHVEDLYLVFAVYTFANRPHMYNWRGRYDDFED